MKKFTNPLESVKISSPCTADWNEMYGDGRKRFCSDCRLNVYNLSGMTQREAENFIIVSEGRVCVQMHCRADGSILTKDCPVGWGKLKKKVSCTATAAFAILTTFFLGIISSNAANFFRVYGGTGAGPEVPYTDEDTSEKFEFGGIMSNLEEVKESISKSRLS